MCDLNDSRGDCWVGPPHHEHRKFEDQCSSPFWTDQPDPQHPEYCLPNEERSDKPKQNTWRDLEWNGCKYDQVCRCGMQHIVPSEHPVCPPFTRPPGPPGDQKKFLTSRGARGASKRGGCRGASFLKIFILGIFGDTYFFKLELR